MTEPIVDWPRVWELFHQTLELPPQERRSLVEATRASDPGLATEIERLLDSHETSGLLDQPLLVHDESAPEPEAGLDPGLVLAGRFEVVREIARGGIGRVYEAHDRELDARVALKVLRPSIADDAKSRERFRREVQLARQVTHRNACRLFDLVHDKESTFLTMEYLDGETLADRLRQHGPLSTQEALSIAKQVAAALDAAHAVGVVHRDLKTGNVMLVDEADATRAVVTDFGLAKISGDELAPAQAGGHLHGRLTEAGQLVGTPATMAPEQLVGGEITPATDIWAFGMLLHEMRTGTLPARATPGPDGGEGVLLPLQAELDRSWHGAIAACLALEPDDRPQSAAQVLDMLSGEGSASGRARSGKRFRGFLAAAIAVFLVTLAVVIQKTVLAPDRANDAAQQALSFEERDFVLIADFENRTGNQLYDGAIEAALRRELDSSGLVNVAPPRRIANALNLMRSPLTTPADRHTAQEICLRDGGIKAYLTGRIDELGSALVLNVDIIDPNEDVSIASFTEEAAEAEIEMAARRLSKRVRQSIGEEIAQIQLSEAKLSRVTTPSLRALEHYSKADAAMVGGTTRRAAEELLRAAIDEDPEFASAYNLLAWALYGQSQEKAEAMAEAQRYSDRALALAPLATEVERSFIRASDLDRRMLGGRAREDELYTEAIALYEAVLQLDPDHVKAARHLNTMIMAPTAFSGFSLRTWNQSSSRQARLRPNSFLAQLSRAFAAVQGVHLDEARTHVARSLELRPEGNSRTWAWLRFFSVHEAWLRGDLEQVRDELERLEGWPSPMRAIHRDYFANWYRTLGFHWNDSHSFSEVLVTLPRFNRGVAAYYAGDLAEFELAFGASFLDLSSRGFILEPVRICYLAQIGLVKEARQALTVLQARKSSRGAPLWSLLSPLEPVLEIVEGRVLAAEGDDKQAISLLENALPRLLQNSGPRGGYGGAVPAYFEGAMALAESLRRQGRLVRAVQVLETARELRFRTYPLSAPAWMFTQTALVRGYRQMGLEADAAKVEAQLRDLLRFAEPGWVLLRELDDREAESLLIPSFD